MRTLAQIKDIVRAVEPGGSGHYKGAKHVWIGSGMLVLDLGKKVVCVGNSITGCIDGFNRVYSLDAVVALVRFGRLTNAESELFCRWLSVRRAEMDKERAIQDATTTLEKEGYTVTEREKWIKKSLEVHRDTNKLIKAMDRAVDATKKSKLLFGRKP